VAAIKKKDSREKDAAVKRLFEGSKMGARVLEVLTELEMSQSDLARKIGVRPQTINFVIRSGHSSSLVVPIARVLRVSPHWLMTGLGQKTDVSVDSRFSRLPVLTAAQVVTADSYIDRFLSGEEAIPEAVTAQISNRSFAMVVESEAMRPEILVGDLVIVDPTIRPVAGDLVVAVISKVEPVLRRYRVKGRDEKGVAIFELYATHPDHESFVSDLLDVQLRGVVSERRRSRAAAR